MKRIATTLLLAGLFATPMLALPPPATAGVHVGISIGIAPPPLPVYVQPMAPGPGYMWTPGYWAWGDGGYYWVPGTWVMPPEVGLLWTPGWWGWSAGYYRWHAGYWGRRVGFYGGINYGFGYFGVGYVGGYWRGPHFYYNRAVNHVDVRRIHNVYVNRTVINNVHVNRVSYNGGRSGIMARPTTEQRHFANERHWSPTPMQAHHRESAMRDPGQHFASNHGQPRVFATPHTGNFEGRRATHEQAVPHARVTTGEREYMRPAQARQRNEFRGQPPRSGKPVRDGRHEKKHHEKQDGGH